MDVIYQLNNQGALAGQSCLRPVRDPATLAFEVLCQNASWALSQTAYTYQQAVSGQVTSQSL